MARKDAASYAIHQVQQNIALGEQVKAALIKEFGEDDELIADMVEGETNLHMWLPLLFDAREDVRALIEANKTQEKKLKDRRAKLEDREERFKKVIADALELCPDRKVETVYGLRFLTKRRKTLIIDDENKIPSSWYVTPPAPEPRPDKNAILEAIKGGENIPGCRYEVNGSEYTLTEKS